MRLPATVPIALAALLSAAGPGRLAAQADSSGKGKIDDVERSARDAKRKGSGDGEGGGLVAVIFEDGLYDGAQALARAVWSAFTYVPRTPGQGYLAYPYAGSPAGETYVRRGVGDGRTFGAVSASYFADDQSTLRAGHFSVEWAGGMLYREIEYSAYVEPRPNETDHLQMLRISFAAMPPLGDIGYAKLGGGLQIVTLGTGDAASGPEFEAGVQLFPRRPFGIGATARVAPMTWSGGPSWGVGFVELVGNASVLIERFELQAGYRWTRIGVGAPFRGPTLGMRVWF
jgi:hypothetical protein